MFNQIDKLTAKMFSQEGDKKVFAPYGKWVKKYPVDEQQEQKLKEFFRIFYPIALAVLLTAAFLVGGYLFYIAIPFMLVYYVKVFSIVDTTLSAKERLDIRAIIDHILEQLDIEGTIIAAIAGGIMFVLNLQVLFNSDVTILGLLGVIFWGACLFFVGKYIYEYYNKKKDKAPVANTPEKKEEELITPKIVSEKSEEKETK